MVLKMSLTLENLLENDGFTCPECGRKHFASLKEIAIGKDALASLPAIVKKYGKHPFVLCDRDTYEAAGKRVTEILGASDIPFKLHIIERTHPAPDERIVGEAFMWIDHSCDMLIAVGGGVINDTGKIVAEAYNIPDVIVSTAPSMDGFASATSSMERCGLKTSLNSKCPEVVIGDTAILAKAPKKMIASGMGDMLAKYVSIVEWKLGKLVLDEYYCPFVAKLVMQSLNECVANGEAALAGDEAACEKVMRGLVLSGLGMNYTGISRPASGTEHYISHFLDMRSLEFGTFADFHGVQCALGTLMVIRGYERLAEILKADGIDREKAIAHAESFDRDGWFEFLIKTFGSRCGQSMIDTELNDKKYDLELLKPRLDRIIAHKDEILTIISELPSSIEIESFMKKVGLPTTAAEFGASREELRAAFLTAKDIRNKYGLGRLTWDIGLINTITDSVIETI